MARRTKYKCSFVKGQHGVTHWHSQWCSHKIWHPPFEIWSQRDVTIQGQKVYPSHTPGDCKNEVQRNGTFVFGWVQLVIMPHLREKLQSN